MSDDLLVKYLLGEASPAERRQVEAWIAEERTNQRYFEHFKLIWDKSRELAAHSTADEDMAWQRFQQRMNSGRSPRGMIRSFPQRSGWWRVAAILIATAAIVSMIYYFTNNAAEAPVTVAATNASQVDTLPDGSVITLNRHSSLSYPGKFSKDTRIVELQGEAFFSVTPDKDKPFIVHVNGITVKVVGTSFNIKATGDKTEIIVETGLVQVINKRQTITVTPREKLVVAHPDSTLVKEKVTDQLYSYYRNKEFVCDHTPLWKLVQVLNEAYDAHIVIGANEIRNLPLTTTFNDESLDNILDIISKTLDITVTRDNSRIILK
jgi:transmembrane sensor